MSVVRVINTPDGFVTREDLAASSAAAPEPAAAPSTRVHNGAVRFTHGQEEPVQQLGVTRHTTSYAGVAGGSVMATRQRVNGRDTVELVPGMTGSRTVMAMALREGVVREIAPGVYEDTKANAAEQSAPAAVQQPSQQRQEPQPSSTFTPSDVAAWREALAGVPESAVNATVASMTSAIANGTDMQAAARRLAQNTGMKPEEAERRIGQAALVQEAVLERAMAQAGLQGDELQAFYDAARAHPQRLTDALMHLVHGHDARRFVTWGQEYLGQVQRRSGNRSDAPVDSDAANEETLRAAGFETHRTSGGVLIAKPAGWGGKWVPAADILKS